MVRREQERQPSYWWLKLILILAVGGVIYLLATKQTMLLIEIVVAIIIAFILYFVIRNRLDNREYEPMEKAKTTYARPQKIDNGNGHDTSKIPTDKLVEELTRRGQVK